MRIVNLTPHPLTLVSQSGTETVVLPEATPARVASTPGTGLDSPPEVALYSAPNWGAVEGLPTPVEGTIYVVSALVAGRVEGRPDVYSPGTGPKDGAVRDKQGRIIGVTRLIRSC